MLPRLVTPIPGPKSRKLAGLLRLYECHTVTAFGQEGPIFLSRGRGTNLWDVDGNRFLDLSSGFGVASLGHGPREVTSPAQRQLARLCHAMGDLHPAETKAILCQKLSSVTFEQWGAGTGKTILTNSGSEAVEVALKTAFLATGRPGILCFEGAYHGLSYGALAVGGLPWFRLPFEGHLACFAKRLPFPDCWHCPWAGPQDPCNCPPECRERFQKLLWKEIQTGSFAGILAEPVLGRGGQIVPPDWFLPLLRDAARQGGLLLILDEILTGFYRTGPRFACDRAGVVPDILCLGKALTHGFPMGACVGQASIMDRWPPSQGEALHTSTFLGNPVGCRMALEALSALERDAPRLRILEKGELLLEGLRKLAVGYPILQAPRGAGLLVGVDVVEHPSGLSPRKAARIVQKLLRRGIILVPSGRKGESLSFCPPLVVTEKEILWALGQMESVLQEEALESGS
jgi:4-aminobutyrate aminotransferase-like enzyme